MEASLFGMFSVYVVLVFPFARTLIIGHLSIRNLKTYKKTRGHIPFTPFLFASLRRGIWTKMDVVRPQLAYNFSLFYSSYFIFKYADCDRDYGLFTLKFYRDKKQKSQKNGRIKTTRCQTGPDRHVLGWTLCVTASSVKCFTLFSLHPFCWDVPSILFS